MIPKGSLPRKTGLLCLQAALRLTHSPVGLGVQTVFIPAQKTARAALRHKLDLVRRLHAGVIPFRFPQFLVGFQHRRRLRRPYHRTANLLGEGGFCVFWNRLLLKP